MQPANLQFTRSIRFEADVTIYFTPRSTGKEVVHQRAHIVLLTDLFLMCEMVAPEERKPDAPDMWLCYPPLAGKHLLANEMPGQLGKCFRV
jgi:hypothetical protein